MRFGVVHRVMTDALAALGILALVFSGQFNRWMSGAIIGGLVLAILLREPYQKQTRFKHLESIIVVLLLVVQVSRLLMNQNVLDVLVEFAAVLQIIRLLTRRGAAHDQQVIVLALLHLIAGTVLGGGLGYGICFLGVLVVAPGALVLSHLRREVEGNYRQGARDRTGLPVDVPRILRSRRVVGRTFLIMTCLLSVPIFVFTGLLFVLFPRVGLSLLLLNRNQSGRMIGFSGRVDLGEVGLLRSDPTLAMRIEIDDLPNPPLDRLTLHLRGTALDSYDGRAWSQSEPAKRPADADGGFISVDTERFITPSRYPDMKIDLEPIDPPVVFLPPETAALRFRPKTVGFDSQAPALRGAEGEIRYQPTDDRGLHYEVYLSQGREPSFSSLPDFDRARYLAVPSRLPSRIRKLAEEWTANAKTPFERAAAIERHLHTEYRYDLASPSGRASEPLDDFLFESKRGHCEFYSTAMAVLLRTVGVPTRNVTGFIGGSYNRYGKFYAVRQGDAHSWVEAYIDGSGWLTFDPTPPLESAPKSELSGVWANLRDFMEASSQRWERHVVGYDLAQQLTIFNSLSKKYQRANPLAGTRWGNVRTSLWIIGAGVSALFVIRWVRRRRKVVEPYAHTKHERKPSAIVATALYENLENAMLVLGVGRSAGMPPLKHAQTLADSEHPLADEILELTRVYVAARFGGAEISADGQRDFERRVKLLRARKSGPREEAQGAEA